jgi:hypothetical protein
MFYACFSQRLRECRANIDTVIVTHDVKRAVAEANLPHGIVLVLSRWEVQGLPFRE